MTADRTRSERRTAVHDPRGAGTAAGARTVLAEGLSFANDDPIWRRRPFHFAAASRGTVP